MRPVGRLAAWCAWSLLAILATGGRASAAGPAPLAALEMAVTYAHGALQVYEIAAAAPGSTMALPVAAGARQLKVSGGGYSLGQLGPTGRSVFVKSRDGQASVRYAIPEATDRDVLFTWRSEVPVRRVLMLTGPKVHPSGLGTAPFSLGGRVEVGGQSLVSFGASDLPAGFTERWMLELGQPGAWLANLFAAVGVALPLLFIGLAIRGVWRRRERKAA